MSDALESVLTQDFQDFELLLVDDGSSDRSTQIAQDAARREPSKVRYLEHPNHSNCGMSAARNLGLRQARGEFITFLDGDDRFRPGMLGEQVAVLDAEPEAGMVCGGYIRWRSWQGGTDEIYLSGHRNGLSIPPETTFFVYPLGWSNSPKSAMIRRSTLGGIECEDQFRGLYEDQVFYSKVFLATPVFFTDAIWVDYRDHANSSTAQHQWHEYVTTRLEFLDWFEAYLLSQEFIGKAAILAKVKEEQRMACGLLRPWLRRQAKRMWIKLQGLVGARERYRRHSHVS